ncbi:hypothetical protein AGABI1DRAFT_91692 [Agaricus bisporus var. burnettii JB137-S8]|uniref:3'-5' exonuclease n=1 Tax=Agaricus bisporus var. burnettii (strain JB137-S8 / ATCC MYA-4627 / FGSC 10392) TaxID=597362 RepID=K5XB80_AGABU|nr:uncharacterized protein AGABI1DRAFT_91692 [Agaricus bisporus var. burnettii JB137-S8]EKM80528.1 hypothetical protein AGABI1DRAFT_91692 [Agaricus bisporus var. burnettii JB137-S8]
MDVEGGEALFSHFFWSDDFAAELALAEGNIVSEIAPQEMNTANETAATGPRESRSILFTAKSDGNPDRNPINGKTVSPTSDAAADAPAKRRPGRSKGSKNKFKAADSQSEPRRPVGRPAGSGNRQLEHARLAALGQLPVATVKQKPGRPPKAKSAGGHFDIQLGQFVVNSRPLGRSSAQNSEDTLPVVLPSALPSQQPRPVAPQSASDCVLPQCDPEQLVEAGATEEDNAEPGDDAYLMRDGIGLEDGDDSYEGHENKKPGSLPPWPSPNSRPNWDQRILDALPPALAHEFPAYLTHQSRLAKSTFHVLRSCFQSGMGAKQFSDALQLSHLLSYDILRLQYLSTVITRKSMGKFLNQQFEPFLSFDDTSPKGYCGYVPSSQWLRDLYNAFIESHQNEINQHMSMLTANICGIDHSHKFPKHIIRVDGVPIFTGLLTMTNEVGEIRVFNLVGSKSHEAFRSSLEEVQRSLITYGHPQPSIIYTDNMIDKAFLEGIFPSLRQGVTPVEKYSQLEPFTIPSDINIYVKKTPSTINDAMRQILDNLEDENQKLVIGFDTEWNMESSIDEIAYTENFKVERLVALRKLPHQLALLLENPNVIKVGRMVNTDLRSLQNASSANTEFVGGIDLAKFARDHLIPLDSRCSLSDICASVLGRRLNKNVSERLSNQWENDNLTPQQLNYAAQDVYAALCIYKSLYQIPLPSPLPTNPEIGLQVQIYHDDHTRLIAYGQISHQSPRCLDGVDLNKHRIMVEVTRIVVPGAIIRTHRKPLSEFGPVPFKIIILRSRLKVSSSKTSDTSSCCTISNKPATASTSQVTLPEPTISPNVIEDANSSIELALIANSADFIPLAALMEEQNQQVHTSEHSQSKYVTDQSCLNEGKDILGVTPTDWPTLVRSRILKDPFHILKTNDGLNLGVRHSHHQ